MTLSVLLADDDEPTLVGTRVAIEAGGLRVVASVTSAGDAVLAAVGTRPDVALVSVALSGGGIAAAEQIAREAPATAVVLIGSAPTDEQLFGALRAGAAGFLLRETDPDRLAHALRGAINGEAPIPRTLVTRLVGEFRRNERRHTPVTGPRGEELSRREAEVVRLLADGLDTRAVAAELRLSDVTVRRHVSSAVAKLGVADRAAAIAALQAAAERGP
ncbi:MAG: response regulator transcription factor [Solirubrobacteraceae bacterium]